MYVMPLFKCGNKYMYTHICVHVLSFAISKDNRVGEKKGRCATYFRNLFLFLTLQILFFNFNKF